MPDNKKAYKLPGDYYISTDIGANILTDAMLDKWLTLKHGKVYYTTDIQKANITFDDLTLQIKAGMDKTLETIENIVKSK